MDQKKESRKAEEKSGWKGPRGRACTLIVKLWCFIFCDAGPASSGNWAAHDPKTNPLSGPIPAALALFDSYCYSEDTFVGPISMQRDESQRFRT
ncbi:hypothetical protein EJF18_20806 [Clavispora lusitaniae]|uniref:Uncharacterized protein n=1 Tax=Clavispora lusitaniae TaxID=36911 RepID=A0ACD0WHR9_CLALS|nr:hypothetical protein EJF14_20806 [Clavispora lusitaniae]QFZ32554.1 hypothetical protein EJF16_20806 [Clavispora lusitaniae]QFZ38223.1 hypothetical protein EJF15_20806 [Clavispora lusitaniae]QFZ43906.1 hypothetical protein EJF18_20806 [Clavispora lusitaniae]QFZ49583.1 hypothetical protein EJF17_20806 [Clavispora lusitaniae]